MELVEIIMDKYKNADEAQRLSMFLSYRELRPLFLKIDMDGWVRASPTRSKCSGWLALAAGGAVSLVVFGLIVL